MQLQSVGRFREPPFQTRRVCYAKICDDECHSKSEIMLVAGALSVCDLFIKSVFFFALECLK